MLQVLLFKAEANWSYAMDLKKVITNSQDKKPNTRKQHHVKRKLAKSLKWARLLNGICKQRTDANTQQECEAYEKYIAGIHFQERQEWRKAIVNFIKSRTIYNELIEKSDSLQSVFYKEKTQFLEQSIRYCHQQNDGFIMDTLEQIVAKYSKNQNESGEQMEIEGQNTRNSLQIEQKNSFIEVEWRGQKYPIKHPKALNYYKEIQQQEHKLFQNKSTKENQIENEALHNEDLLSKIYKQNKDTYFHQYKKGLYLEIFSLYDDCIKVMLKEKDDKNNTEGESEIYGNIVNFLILSKIKLILERNTFLIRNAIKQFDKEDGINNLEFLSTKKAFKQKFIRPTEIIKLCDNILQVFKQIMEIERQNPNLEHFRKLDVLEIYYKAVRCYYVACVYFANQKYIESLSLLKQCENFNQMCEGKFQDIKNLVEQRYLTDNKKLNSQIKYLIIKAKIGMVENQTEDQTNIITNLGDTNIDGKLSIKTIQSLIENSEERVRSNLSFNKIQNIPIMNFPPRIEQVGCKLIQFDLGNNYLQYPKIEDKEKTQSKQSILSKLKFWK
ncbi:signal recognition particle 68, putative [Ichthyophthirius multifiliis]|uniref:Signal recognition particle subunit SRP68 n=1 Tax=Ichthyophthirius multifiliis TaxID=5932 RepID=G0QPA4_ICHMU|nr:signal recognition particle 68, putative [Ichthyophthirius multifiliis]EGR32941.1 signal recognition particle 68, putative [Ichthyophthirius multifiliis]|eukprot:XP_004036927.1 signal recognition particle 68, putative [Ichthyophthirius multifiliis]